MKEKCATPMRPARLGGFRGAAMGRLPGVSGRVAVPPNIIQNFRNAVATRCRRYKKALKHCRKSFSESSVHDLRVETRRFLALITLLRWRLSGDSIDQAVKRLRKLFKRLAGLRDAHVQLKYFHRQKRAQPEMGHL